jgi:hypothetical protein
MVGKALAGSLQALAGGGRTDAENDCGLPAGQAVPVREQEQFAIAGRQFREGVVQRGVHRVGDHTGLKVLAQCGRGGTTSLLCRNFGSAMWSKFQPLPP